MARETIKKTMIGAALAASMLSGSVAQAKSDPDADYPTSQKAAEQASGGFWNGVKKVFGLPYQETEYWDTATERDIKSTAERALWGMWTYKKDSFGKNGVLTETRYYEGNNEIKRDEFHTTGNRSWTADIKDGHPVGRVRAFDSLGWPTFEGSYDLEGREDGVHKVMKKGILTHETPFSHGLKEGEERIYNPTTGSLQKTIPWHNNQKDGVEHNLENGDFFTYHNGVRDGAFKETLTSTADYTKTRLERFGTYANGKMYVEKEREFDSQGKLKRETCFDEQGNRHGEERIANGFDFDINPYNHGRLDGRQTRLNSFKTWKNGVQEGPYLSSTNMFLDENMNPVVIRNEEGMYENGQAHPSEVKYFKMIYQEDGSFGSLPLTELEAKTEAAKWSGQPSVMNSLLGQSSDTNTTQSPKRAKVKTPTIDRDDR